MTADEADYGVGRGRIHAIDSSDHVADRDPGCGSGGGSGVTPVTRAPDEVCSRVTPKYPRRGKGSGCATTIPAINPTTNLTIDILIGSTQTVIWICSLATKAGEKGTERYYDKVQHVARSLSTTRRKSNNSHADEVLGSTSTTARLRSRRAERFCNVP